MFMKVVSINIALPTEIEYQGKVVSTGIFKKPVSHKIYVNQQHMSGDGQADLIHHGGDDKAVYGFSADHYHGWRQTLAAPDLGYGAFGENLTISGLAEHELSIGDRLLIGDAILEVSQPRVPCFKLGIALDNIKAPSLFTKTYATGVYFRVIKQGFIAPGNVVTVTKTNKKTVSVYALFRAYYDRSYTDTLEVLTTAAQLDELAAEWQQKVAQKLAKIS